MAFNFIRNFQMKLHNLLASDQEITAIIDKIYLSVVQDAGYPFLLINIIKAVDQTLFMQAIYDIEFEICVFTKDKKQATLTNLADKITTRLAVSNTRFSGYIIAGIKANSISFERAGDLITQKLVINYKALIKNEL